MDAVEVTRRIGVQYLWIDSLCIIQDDRNDWEDQSSRMADIYKNAYLTLAADASPDSSGGLSWPFQPIQKIQYNASQAAFLRDTANDDNLKYSPLAQRAWVFQEMVLSRRVVHFAKDQMWWECPQVETCEDGTWTPWNADADSGLGTFQHLKKADTKIGETLHDTWRKLMICYN